MKSIAFIVSRFPYPLEKGDKLRAYQHIKNLYHCGYKVHLIALSDIPVSEVHYSEVKKYCQTVHVLRLNFYSVARNLLMSLFRKLPLQVGYFYSKSHHHKINQIIEKLNPGAIYCQLIRTALYAKSHHDIPCVIDYQDAFSKGTKQRMQQARLIFRPVFARELRLVQRFESQSFKWFQKHLIISEQDRLAMPVEEKTHMKVLPNGIDTGFFQPMATTKKYDILFVGNMNYPPNVDAALFLVRDVMPSVWKKYPQMKVLLAGANPDQRIRKLNNDSVSVTGWVEDIRKCYSDSKIFIAPMRIGTGLQNKLLEAMAMKLPCITTPLSFEPLGAISGKHILTGENATELADKIILLAGDERFASQLAQEGYRFVTGVYSMDHSRKILCDTFSD